MSGWLSFLYVQYVYMENNIKISSLSVFPAIAFGLLAVVYQRPSLNDLTFLSVGKHDLRTSIGSN